MGGVDELIVDQDEGSDGGDEELTAEQQGMGLITASIHHNNRRRTVQLIDVLEQVRQVVGGEEDCGISDREIKDSAWYYFFDTEKTVQWCLGAYICRSEFIRLNQYVIT